MGYGYFDPMYFVVMAVAGLVSAGAAVLVKGRIKAMHGMPNRRGLTGREVAQMILDRNGIKNVRVESVGGWLSDHYSPGEKVVRLSPEVGEGRSISSLAVAAHEVGHAIQHHTGYPALALRSAAVPVANFGPSLGIVLMMVGGFIGMMGLVKIGIVLFGATFLFAVITLPVEFNASSRALVQIRDLGLASEQEYVAARKVLTAAALTYVAAAVVALIYLLYYAWRFGLIGGRRH